MTVQEQSSPRFEINPLPARADPAGREGRSPPPRPLIPAPDLARQSEPPDWSRRRIRVQAPPSGPASTTELGEKLSNFFFFWQTPPPLAQSWGMKFSPPGARGLGRGRSAIPSLGPSHPLPSSRSAHLPWGSQPGPLPLPPMACIIVLPTICSWPLETGVWREKLANRRSDLMGAGSRPRLENAGVGGGGIRLKTRQACSRRPPSSLSRAPPGSSLSPSLSSSLAFPSFSGFRASGSFSMDYCRVLD